MSKKCTTTTTTDAAAPKSNKSENIDSFSRVFFLTLIVEINNHYESNIVLAKTKKKKNHTCSWPNSFIEGHSALKTEKYCNKLSQQISFYKNNDFYSEANCTFSVKPTYFKALCVGGARYIHAGEIHKKKRPQNLILNSTALPILCYVHRFLNYHKNLILLTLYSMEGLVRDRYREM